MREKDVWEAAVLGAAGGVGGSKLLDWRVEGIGEIEFSRIGCAWGERDERDKIVGLGEEEEELASASSSESTTSSVSASKSPPK